MSLAARKLTAKIAKDSRSTQSRVKNKRTYCKSARLCGDLSVKKGGRDACCVVCAHQAGRGSDSLGLRKTRPVKRQPLCAGCSNAHVQYGAEGRRAISCAFGGMVRPVTLDVLYCTDYRDRKVKTPIVRIGFAPEGRGNQAEA
jgi:hypothetical protein